MALANECQRMIVLYPPTTDEAKQVVALEEQWRRVLEAVNGALRDGRRDDAFEMALEYVGDLHRAYPGLSEGHRVRFATVALGLLLTAAKPADGSPETPRL
jgi:hypothetical protein